jgi:hypothetical protein
MKNAGLLFLLFFISIYSLQSQTNDVSYTIHSSAGLSSDTTLPFWLSANQYASVPNSDYGLLNTTIFKDYDTPNTLFDLSYKASATGFIAQENKLLLYTHYF